MVGVGKYSKIYEMPYNYQDDTPSTTSPESQTTLSRKPNSSPAESIPTAVLIKSTGTTRSAGEPNLEVVRWSGPQANPKRTRRSEEQDNDKSWCMNDDEQLKKVVHKTNTACMRDPDRGDGRLPSVVRE